MIDFETEETKCFNTGPEKVQLCEISKVFMRAPTQLKHSYNVPWLEHTTIRNPQDVVVIHELIWLVKPELIVETSIARG